VNVKLHITKKRGVNSVSLEGARVKSAVTLTRSVWRKIGALAGPVDPANTQLGVAKRGAGDIVFGFGLGPKSATREVAGSAFCPLTRVAPPANVCGIDTSGASLVERGCASLLGETLNVSERQQLTQ
jgi:hypothetical protein